MSATRIQEYEKKSVAKPGLHFSNSTSFDDDLNRPQVDRGCRALLPPVRDVDVHCLRREAVALWAQKRWT
jgi:hypothetical protein